MLMEYFKFCGFPSLCIQRFRFCRFLLYYHSCSTWNVKTRNTQIRLNGKINFTKHKLCLFNIKFLSVLFVCSFSFHKVYCRRCCSWFSCMVFSFNFKQPNKIRTNKFDVQSKDRSQWKIHRHTSIQFQLHDNCMYYILSSTNHNAFCTSTFK